MLLEEAEKELGITPDPAVAAYMKALGEHHNVATDIAIKALGLEGCADTLVVSWRAETLLLPCALQRRRFAPACPNVPLFVSPPAQGNAMIRGVSGGQKKRVTTGEMLVGPSNVLFADEVREGARCTCCAMPRLLLPLHALAPRCCCSYAARFPTFQCADLHWPGQRHHL